MIDVRRAIDLHCHTHPCLFPRLDDDVGVARQAAVSGLRGIMLKSHHESTVSRAYFVERALPGIRVFGGLVLNRHVGGINPHAVQSALQLGAKQIWMPTIDAAHHRAIIGGYGPAVGNTDPGPSDGLTVTGSDGALTDESLRVLDLIAAHDAILGTAHLSPAEIQVLVPEARRRGVNNVLITHPFFTVPKLDLGTLKDLTRLGALAEFTYCSVSPMWRATVPDVIAEAVRTVGASACILTSDAGQPHNPYPGEALRMFAQMLHELGISAGEIDEMIRVNPARLLRLED